ncbi:hypothetical protein ACFQ3Z_31385 [Streptomyces nogalater]
MAPALTPPSLPDAGASKDSSASRTSCTREISALMSSRRRIRISSSRLPSSTVRRASRIASALSSSASSTVRRASRTA